jgi:crotonobetainyl-CoA:carnitine CoA-transferase CaiB-like acyl-CoA transferase
MSITGDANGPGYRLGVAIADITAGMFAAYGTSLALFARQRSNQGQLVDVGMLDSVAALLTYQAGIHFATDGIPERLGNRHPTVVPYETFEATDGEFVLAVGNDALWRKFCSVARLEEIVADPRFATNRARVQAYDELRPLLARALRTRSRRTWIKDLTAAGVPCGDVRNIAQVLADPQLAAREMVAELEHTVAGKIRVLGIPIKLSETPGTVKNPPPALGEHTDKVLEELLDIGQAERSRLRQLGAI